MNRRRPVLMRMHTLVLALVAAFVGVSSAHANTESRFALVIAAHAGLPGETPLEHAGRDATRMADVLVQLGGFLPDNVVRLVDVDAARARDALARLNARIRREREPGRAVTLLVYYSGHADNRALHLGESLLPWDELRNAVDGSSADLRLLIVDACRSGHATRVKGFQTTTPFALPTPGADQIAEGFVILSSAAEGEDAQESDTISGSFFTHHLVSALRGAADDNGDEAITLDEAFRYARDRTIAATATTLIGVQHPTFRYHLKGRSNVVLTRLAPTSAHGRVILPGAGHFIFHAGQRDGAIVAEVSAQAAKARLALGAGRYFVRWREPNRFREGTVRVEANRDTAMVAGAMEVFEYGRFVRKGGDGGVQPVLTLAIDLAPAVPSGYAPAVGAALGLSLELEPLTIDLFTSYAFADTVRPLPGAPLHTVTALGGVRHAVDLSGVTLSFGLRVGLATFIQSPQFGPTRSYLGPAFEAVTRFDVSLWGPLMLVAEGGLRIIGVEVREAWRTVRPHVPVLGWVRLGVGLSF